MGMGGGDEIIIFIRR